jgi:DNA modification methylase
MDSPTYRLYHGDCLDILPTLEAGSVDAVVTDPPYGISCSSNYSGLHGDLRIQNDHSVAARDAALSAIPVPFIVFGSWKAAKPERTKGVLIWDKGGHAGMGDLSFPWKPNFEEIYVSDGGFIGSRDSSVLRHFIHPTFNATRSHPYEKPVELILRLLGKCPKNWTILDPFMGTGAVGVACMKTGRNFIGIELDAEYYRIAEQRIRNAAGEFVRTDKEKATGQMALFGE